MSNVASNYDVASNYQNADGLGGERRGLVAVLTDADTGYLAPVVPGPPVRYFMSLPAFGERRQLTRMLKVEVSRGEDVACAVYAPALGVGGVGEDLDAALNDMGESAFILAEDYAGIPVEQRDSSVAEALARLEKYLPRPH